MNLNEFKALLKGEGEKHFRIQLPDGSPVPLSFHVTEIGKIQKTFIDCGGTMRGTIACQLQIWVGEDVDHRMEARKAAAILEKAKAFLPDENIPVEVEYEDRVISQYTIEAATIDSTSVTLKLSHKHTECLAPELCVVPPKSRESKCHAPSGCC